MLTRLLAAAGLAIALAANSGPASAAEDWHPEGHDSAVAACLDLNEYKPVELDAATEDGLGDWIVWVKDKDGDLWLCNANAQGDVYANVLLNGDLLNGDGPQLIADDEAGRNPGPAESAERLCSAVGSHVEDLNIVETVDDGLGDYLVWLQNSSGAYYMCDASSNSTLYSFEPVQYPLDTSGTNTDGPCCAPFENRQADWRQHDVRGPQKPGPRSETAK